MNALSFDKQVRVISSLVDGCSIRATERLCEAHRDTIMRLGVAVGEACCRLHDHLMRGLQVNVLELDEIWSFVGKKQKRLTDEDSPELGDQYTYLALDAIKRAIISFEVGKRTAETTRTFAADLRSRIVNRPQISTDGFAPYIEAIELAFGADVDYAMIIDPAAGDMRRTPIAGNPDLARTTTSHVERQNGTVRTNVHRFIRKTYGFSKKLIPHRAAVALYVVHYNFCKVHQTLRCTPAMEIGVTDHIWSVGELIDAALRTAPRPAPAVPPRPEPAAGSSVPLPSRSSGEMEQLGMFGVNGHQIRTPTGRPSKSGHSSAQNRTLPLKLGH